MNESFYTYLGGPRTFWGGNRTKIINNNFFGMPMFGREKRMCNKINPLFLFAAAMQNNFMGVQMPFTFGGGYPLGNSIMPYQNIGLTPYYNFTKTQPQEGAGGIKPELTNLETVQNNMNQLGFTKNNGYSVTLTPEGKVQYAYTDEKGNTRLAYSLVELTKKTTPEASDTDTTSLEDSLATQGQDEVSDGSDKKDADEADEADDDTNVKNSDGVKPPSRKGSGFKKADLSNAKINGKNLEWKHYDKCSNYVKTNIKNNTTVDDLVDKMLVSVTGEDKDKTKATYKKWVIAANPGAIKDGKVVDVNKLDLPVYKTTASNNTTINTTSSSAGKTKPKNKVTSQSRIIAKQEDKDGSLKLVYKGSSNYIYKKNGSSSWDATAVFVIDGKEYTLKETGLSSKLDYYEITDQREIFADFKLIDPLTGHFQKDKKLFNKTENYNGYREEKVVTYTLEGNGQLNGAVISLKNGNVVLTKNPENNNSKSVLMDDIMLGNKKL